jgi:NAD-dependent deacetylase
MQIPAQILADLRAARHVTVLTGAGISAESGLATFRDNLTGLWEKYSPMDFATPEAFERDPALVWGWYEWRRMHARRAQPNAGHLAIAGLQRALPRVTVITQNVDDLHERAGTTAVIHLHGSIHESRCERCTAPFSALGEDPDQPAEGRRLEPPRCTCGGRIRPGVVWFGESLPPVPWAEAERAVEQCQVFLCVGTSGVVEPAASLALYARNNGATTVQVNVNDTGLRRNFNFDLRGSAGTVLPALLQGLSA